MPRRCSLLRASRRRRAVPRLTMTWLIPTAALVPAVHGRRAVEPDPPIERELAERLRARHDARRAAGAVRPTCVTATSEFDALMRRAVWRALARALRRRRRGSGAGCSAGIPRRSRSATACSSASRRCIQGRFDGRCVIGDHVWIGPQSLLRRPRPRDRGVRRLGAWREGARLEAHRRAGRRSDHPDRPRDRAGADRRLGRHRRQRRDPARRHGRARARSSAPGAVRDRATSRRSRSSPACRRAFMRQARRPRSRRRTRIA